MWSARCVVVSLQRLTWILTIRDQGLPSEVDANGVPLPEAGLFALNSLARDLQWKSVASFGESSVPHAPLRRPHFDTKQCILCAVAGFPRAHESQLCHLHAPLQCLMHCLVFVQALTCDTAHSTPCGGAWLPCDLPFV